MKKFKLHWTFQSALTFLMQNLQLIFSGYAQSTQNKNENLTKEMNIPSGSHFSCVTWQGIFV